MKTQRVPMIARPLLALILVFALLPWIGIAESTLTYSDQLIDAAGTGDLWLAKWLLDKGADANSKNQYGQVAELNAAEYGHLDIVKLLLDKGADVNAKNDTARTALMQAATSGHLEVVRLLLDKGADVNAKADSGWTALMGAAWKGHLGVVKLLLEKGAKVDEGKDDLTAIGAAAGGGHLEVVKLLLEKGADVNARDKDGSTALMSAAGYGHLALLEVLLEKGVDVNARDKDGSTALMEAAAKYYRQEQARAGVRQFIRDTVESIRAIVRVLRYGPIGPLRLPRKSNTDPEVVKFLLQKGADVNARAADGSTALKRARKAGTPEIVEVLKAYGAKE